MFKTIKLFFILMLMVSPTYANSPSWCIQVIRCSTLENAKTVYDHLGEQHSKMLEKSNGTYTVNVGFYKRKNDAINSLEEWKTRYPGAFLRTCGQSELEPADVPAAALKPAVATKKANILPAKEIKPSVPEKPKTVDEKKESNPPLQNKTVKKETPAPAPVNVPPQVEKRIETAKVSLAKNSKSPVPEKPKTVDKKKESNPPLQNKTVKKETPAPAPVNTPPLGEKKTESAKVATDGMTESLKTGMQNYYDKKYNEAIKSLAQYISLSPKSEHNSAALFIIGKSMEEMGKPLLALKVFGRVLEQYPKSPEAFTGMIAMADISVNHPTVRYPVFMKGSEYVKDPIIAYDKALGLKIPDQLAEAIRYKKGRALLKQGQHRKSYDVCSALLRDAPLTVYKVEILDIMRINAIALIDSYYQEGDHVAAMNLFFEAKDKQLIDYEDTDTMLKSSVSITHMGMYDSATTILNNLKVKKKNAKSSTEIDKTAEEIERIRSASYTAQDATNDRWRLYETGREYLRANDQQMAEKTLIQLKSKGGDPFWSKITDYALDENKWDQYYHEIVNKKK